MTLGSIIARLADEAFVEEALAGLGDVVLLARLRCAADAAKEPLGYFASALVGDYVQRADDEMWFASVTAASRAPNPAAACLQRMLLQAVPENEHLGGAAAGISGRRGDGDTAQRAGGEARRVALHGRSGPKPRHF